MQKIIIKDLKVFDSCFSEIKAAKQHFLLVCQESKIDYLFSEKLIYNKIFDGFNPIGKLPIKIPSSQYTFEKRKEDLFYKLGAILNPFSWELSNDNNEVE